MERNWRKITSVNGFDKNDKNNARQNNYAWSMAEMGDYLYVGTGRNIFYFIAMGEAQKQGIDLKLPEGLTPNPIDEKAEIWRYKKDGTEPWKLVYKAPVGIIGFRFMIRYTSKSGETALYAGGFNSSPEIILFKSTNGETWNTLNTGIRGTSTRAMIVHNEKLYMAVLDSAEVVNSTTQIYLSDDPGNNKWGLVTEAGDPNKNPRGGVGALRSFNGHLYAATARPDGFELWRTEGLEPKKDGWKLVIDKGAGDAANESPLTLGEFKDHLYIGAIIYPPGTQKRFPTMVKPFDLIRVDKNDNWELVVGGRPLNPTNPTTGERGNALSNLLSGMGNPTNLYCWQLREYRGEFYLGTFDWSVLIRPMIYAYIHSRRESDENALTDLSEGAEEFLQNLLDKALPIGNLLDRLQGFDLFKSKDGVHWEIVSLNGFNNPHNYGVRNLFVSENGLMYLGTSNVFDGCEIWVNDQKIRRRSKYYYPWEQIKP